MNYTLDDHANAIILAGGSGSRLWPVSRRSRPKQFQKLLGDQSFVQLAYARVRGIFPAHRIFIQVALPHRDLVFEQLPDLAEENVLLEPEARDTAPAYLMALTSLMARDPDAMASFFYADNIIKDESGPSFEHAVHRAILTSIEFPAFLVTIGVAPKFPHTGLGYIRLGEPIGGQNDGSLFGVAAFIEKPDAELADRIWASRQYLWNTGYKTGRADTILRMMERSCPVFERESANILKAVRIRDHAAIEDSFRRLPRISFESLVSRHSDHMLVMATDLEWSDAGDWDVIRRILASNDKNGLFKSGRVFQHECRNMLVISQTKPIVTMNLSNVIIIETDDALLVMGAESSQEIGRVLEKLAITDPGVL